MDTDVIIVGAGPAGLLLGHCLRAEGIRCVVLEAHTPEHVRGRIRAGLLEPGTVALIERLGLDARLKAQGIPHDAFRLAFGGEQVRIAFAELTGRQMVVYGQTELTADLMQASGPRDIEIIYDAAELQLHDIDTDAPFVSFSVGGTKRVLRSRLIVGCDGFHGPSRGAIPRRAGREFEKVYPSGWLGMLADVPPCSNELIYANHERGFALASMRSAVRSRYYIDVPITEAIEDWPDARVWDELEIRLGGVTSSIVRGLSLEKSIAPLRSYVFEPMRYGSLLLCGDAAHIVPPTGAKGLNLAASDVGYASEAIAKYIRHGNRDGLSEYPSLAAKRVWKAVRFSWSLTRLMHRFPDDSPFDQAIQQAEFDYISSSRAAQHAIAENYVGLSG